MQQRFLSRLLFWFSRDGSAGAASRRANLFVVLALEGSVGVQANEDGVPEVLAIAFTTAHWERKQLARVWKIGALSPVSMV